VLALATEALRHTFGARVVSALLFGSRALGTARPESDYDIAVFLARYDADGDRLRLWELADRLLLESTRARVHFVGFPAGGLAERTTLMFNIRRTAIPLPGMEWPEISTSRISEESGALNPETLDLIAIADSKLEDARAILAARVPGAAAREAYTAALSAARALIFEERTLAPKTHDGTHALFHEIAVRPGRISRDLARVLSQGLEIKIAVDYAARRVLPDERYRAYVEHAAEFVAAVRVLLTGGAA
jgi:uncharacterized protein (UPF0332 family)/predicted nucleotidyltransferase